MRIFKEKCVDQYNLKQTTTINLRQIQKTKTIIGRGVPTHNLPTPQHRKMSTAMLYCMTTYLLYEHRIIL